MRQRRQQHPRGTDAGHDDRRAYPSGGQRGPDFAYGGGDLPTARRGRNHGGGMFGQPGRQVRSGRERASARFNDDIAGARDLFEGDAYEDRAYDAGAYDETYDAEAWEGGEDRAQFGGEFAGGTPRGGGAERGRRERRVGGERQRQARYGGRPEYGASYAGRAWEQGEDWAHGGGQPSQRGRGPQSYRRSDERIREEVCDLLTDDDLIDATEIEVRVDQGEVTLSGTVSDRMCKRAAEDLADAVSGVHNVRNELRVAGRDRQANSGVATSVGGDPGAGGTGSATSPGRSRG